MIPELQTLGDAIFEAAQKAFLKLFENGEHYYYCVLLTTGEALPPCIASIYRLTTKTYCPQG